MFIRGGWFRTPGRQAPGVPSSDSSNFSFPAPILRRSPQIVGTVSPEGFGGRKIRAKKKPAIRPEIDLPFFHHPDTSARTRIETPLFSLDKESKFS
jgi:hypothetical protein